ncbi:hypothetical protein Q1695_009913 [Nippostrongylus brasiliensis]|nr:hypothetical protein Q1695_009913 [Nippostrongylus brasiliensis]
MMALDQLTMSHEAVQHWPHLLFTVLVVVAFAHIHIRIADVERRCRSQEASVSISSGFRQKRQMDLINRTINGNHLWMSSMSRVKARELVGKCLELHKYCTDLDSSDRGPPGPPGPQAEYKVEELKCSERTSLDNMVGPKLIDRALPSLVSQMVFNNSDIEACLKVCLGNMTAEVEEELAETATESAYIQGATANCKLQSVGKPVFHSHTTTYYGSWMRDAYPRTGDDMLKRYLVNHFQGIEVIEFRTEADLRREHVNNIYRLPHVYDGTNHMLFNGSLFFHRAGFPRIGKFDLTSGYYDELEIPGAAHQGNNYLFNKSMNYFDLAIDENALWVLFHYESEPFLSVAKVDINNLTIYETHNLTLINHNDIANGIVICGVLYTIEDSHAQRSFISTGFDFYRQQYSKPNIKWINLYRNANMISYNPYDKRIYVFDHGYLLTVPAHIQWVSK